MQLFDLTIVDPSYPKVRIYSAGSLFTDHELIGNEWLAWGLHQIAGDWLEVILPQRNTFPVKTDLGFRAEDIMQILCTDALMISGNGVEVDSGSIKEKEIAGAIDHPTVMYRGDFRRGGDSGEPDGPTLFDYNLMLGGGRRLAEVKWNSMIAYRNIIEEIGAPKDIRELSERVALYAAEHVVRGIKQALLSDPSPAGSRTESLRVLYQHQIDQHRGLAEYLQSRLSMSVDEFLSRTVDRHIEVNERGRYQALKLAASELGAERLGQRSIEIVR